MDFYFDIGMAVMMRIIKDRKNVAKFSSALAKLYLALENLTVLDSAFSKVVAQKRGA